MESSEMPAQEPERLNPEQQLFQIKTLYETSRELLSLTDMPDILNVLLLMTMGALGSSRGYTLLVFRDGNHLLAARGLEENELKRLEQSVPTILERHFRESPPSSSQGPRILLFNNDLDSDIYPRRTIVFVQFILESGSLGCLALGEKLTGLPYHASDSDLLMSMAHLLVQALNRSHNRKTINTLNRNLEAQNTKLEAALAKAKNAGKQLDRQIYHLKSLHDASLELSRLNTVESMLHAFILNTLGAFSLTHGYVILYDQKSRKLWQTAWPGLDEKTKIISSEEAETFLFAAIKASDFQSLNAMTAQSISAEAVQGLVTPLHASHLKIFRLQDACFGIIGLGAKITSETFMEDEEDLLDTHISHFLPFLNNAQYYETISKLNKDLELKNKQLIATIEELTSSRRRIEILEQFGSNINNLLKREAEGLRKFTLLDLALILAAGLLLGIVFNFSNPNGIHLLPEIWQHPKAEVIGIEEARRKLSTQDALLIDARPQEFFQQTHIPQAINLPPALFDFIYSMKLSEEDLARPIIVYGRNISRHYDEEVAWQLKSQGHEEVYVAPHDLRDMLEQWVSAQPAVIP